MLGTCFLKEMPKTVTHSYNTDLSLVLVSGGWFLLDSEYRARREMLLFMGKSFTRQVMLHLNCRKVGLPSQFQGKHTSPRGKPAHGAVPSCAQQRTLSKGEGLWQSWGSGSGCEPSRKSEERKYYLPFTKQFTATDLAQVLLAVKQVAFVGKLSWNYIW